MVGTHKKSVGGGEHGGAGIEVFAEVLGTNEGVVTTQFADLVSKVFAVERIVFGDMVGGDDEDALVTILSFKFEGGEFFTLEESIHGPGGAREYTGGITRSSHGCEAFVVNVLIHVLSLVDDEEAVGGGTDDAGGGIGGEIGGAGGHEAVHVAVAFLEPAELEEGTLGGACMQPFHGVDGLRAEGGLDADDRSADGGEAGEEVKDEVGEKLVLAGLAGEDDDERIAIPGEDGFEDGVGSLQLVGTQLDGEEAAGEPVNVVELAAEFVSVPAGEVGKEAAAFGGGIGGGHEDCPY